ncbi:MAG: sulfurtransferase-like selenium metabolism protein YedF [Desulfococcaceae bacterium]
MKEIDARGHECPVPIQMTLHALEAPDTDEIRILVDQQSTADGLADFLESQGFAVQMADHEGAISVGGRRYAALAPDPEAETLSAGPGRRTLVVVSDDRIGGDDVWGGKLMARFLENLGELRPDLRWVVFLNGGVKWTAEPGEALETLRNLEEQGVRVGVRGACLKHFGLDGQNAVGEVLSMRDIVAAMQRVDKVVRM